MNCKSLKRVVLNEGLTTLGREDEVEENSDGTHYNGVFEGSWLKEITLPSTLEKIGDNTFAGCYSLEVVWVEDGCTLDISERISINNHLTYYVAVLPAKAMAGDVLLRDLRQLREVVIPEGVDKVGDHWFSHSNVENVTVPKSVKVIEKYAFYECKKLKRIIIPKDVTEI